MQPVVAYLGVGANLGDRAGAILGAVRALARTPGIEVQAVSRLRESAPVGGPPQPDYLNGAIRIATTRSPEDLLAVCKGLEHAAGRDLAAPPNSPRPLDLDVLLYGDRRIATPDLTVPHPRLGEREFVSTPLRELGVEVPATADGGRPEIVRSPERFAAIQEGWLRRGLVTGLVPTMGALHDGHASLCRAARAECDRVAATVFVNPLQFGPGEDFARYPRDLDADLAVLRREGVDLLFAPAADVMFAPDFCSHVAVGAAAEGMEGEVRPGHFAGVATVVAKLMVLARPHMAYFGQKDAQQVAVIRRVCRDLALPGLIRECPIVREADGLALSSRNVYLTPGDRRAAPVLFKALATARERFRAGERDPSALREAALAVLRGEPRCAVDYVELRTEGELAPLPSGPVVAARILGAVRCSDGGRTTRLIDNLALVGDGGTA